MAGFSVPITRWFYQGLPAAGAKIYVYITGSTVLASGVYADGNLTTPTANPITTDSNGEAVFYLSGTAAVRLYVTTSGGTPIRDIDPVFPVPLLSGSLGNGQCQLTKSGSNLVLNPFDGNKLTINGTTQTVAQTTLSASGLSTNTLYYIYAYMNGGAVALEASTTAPSTLSTGIVVKSTDNTRTLVGMARTVTGPAWQDTATQRFVRSWYNDPGIACKNSFTANRSTTSTSLTELNSEIRCEFLAWEGEVFNAAANAYAATASGGNYIYSALAFDSTTAGESPAMSMTYSVSASYQPMTAAFAKTGLAVGYHYMTLLGASASGAVSNTWLATSIGSLPATTISLSSVRG